MRKFVYFNVIIFLLCGFSYLNALITQWTGNTDTSWGDTSNWTDGVPNSSQSVIIPSSITSGNWPNHSSGGSTCYEVANYGTLNITGGTLNVNNGFLSASGSTTTLTGSGAINCGLTGDFDCNGTVTISDNGLIAGGSFTAYAGSTLNLNGGWLSLDGDFNADGTVNIDDAQVYATNFLIGGNVNQTNGSVSVTQNITNSGTVDQTGGTTTASGDFTNNPTGIFRPSSGLWAVRGLDNQGAFNQTGGDVTVSESMTNSGTVDQSGGTFTASQDFTNEPAGIFRPASGLWAVRGLDNQGAFNQTGGDVTISDNMTNSGTIDQTNGTTDNDGDFTNNPTGIFRPSSGLWAVRGLDNQGAFNQIGGQVEVSEDFTNAGTHNISDGTLDVIGPYINSATYNQTGGTASFNGGFTLSSSSTNTQSGGTLNIGGDAAFSSSLINTGSNGELVFNGGTTQSVTNPTTNPNTNMIPNLKVNNNSTVVFDGKTSFAAGNVEVNNGTLDIGSGFLEPTYPGMGNWAVGANSEIIIGGNNTFPNYGTTNLDQASKVTYNSTTHVQEIRADNYGKLEVSGTAKYIENGDVNVGNEFILNNTVVDIRDNDLTLQTGGVFTPMMDCHFATTGSGSFKREYISSGLFPVGPDLTNYNGFSFDNNGTPLTSISVRVEEGINPAHANSAYCLPRTWQIDKVGTLNMALFTFYWTADQENASFTAARVNNRINGYINHTGQVWEILEETIIPAGSGTLEDAYGAPLHNMAIVSGFCLGDGDHPLPVSLSSFTSEFLDDFPVLHWTTQSETDNLGWNVYRSISENGFEEDDYFQSNAELIPGVGTSTEPTDYTFIDEYPVIEGLTYWYWLESVSTTNDLELHGPISLEIPIQGEIPHTNIGTTLHPNYPNPFNPSTAINFSIEENEKGILSIYNLRGQQILKEDFAAGIHQYQWNAEGFTSGIYFYRLQTSSQTITKKMILLK